MPLPAHVKIMLADCREEPVAQLQAGDHLREALTGQAAPLAAVAAGPGVGIVRLTTQSGLFLDCTEDHPVLTDQGLMPAGSLRPGDRVIVPGGMDVCIGNERLLGDFKVYETLLAANGPAAPSYPPCVVANGVVIQAV